MFVTEMLSERGWKMEGFCRWLESLRLDYQRRRDFLLDVFRREVEPTGYASVTCPQGGMFVWIQVFFERHPRFSAKPSPDGSSVAARTNTEVLLLELFERLMNDQGVVFIPSSTFAIPENSLWVENDGHVALRDVSSITEVISIDNLFDTPIARQVLTCDLWWHRGDHRERHDAPSKGLAGILSGLAGVICEATFMQQEEYKYTWNKCRKCDRMRES